MKIKKEHIIAFGIIFLLSLVFLLPILQSGSNWGIRDWGFFQRNREALRMSVAEESQLALWDPYDCGGKPFIGIPQHAFLNPFLIPLLILGTTIGIKINFLIYFLIGGIGMYLVCRKLGIRFVSSLAATSIFLFSSYFSLYLIEGHYWNIVWMLLPLTFYFYLKSHEDLRYSIAAAALMALTILEGHGYGFAFSFLFMGVHSVFESIKTKKFRPIAALVLIVLITVSIGAVKILPTIDFVSNNPRHTGPVDKIGFDFQILYNALTNRDQGPYAHNYPGQLNLAWAEFGMYVGLIVVLLFIAGLVMYYKKEWALLATLAVFLILSFGVNSIIPIWNWLLSLPIFESMRQAPRVKVYLLFLIAIFAGKALSKIEHIDILKIGKKNLKNSGRIICAVILIIILFDLFAVSRVHLKEAFIIPAQNVQKGNEFFNVEAAEVSTPYTVDQVLLQHYESNLGLKPLINLEMGLGTTNCYDPTYIKRTSIAKIIWNESVMNYQENPNYRGEVFFESDVNAGRLLDNATNKAHIESMDFQGFVLVADKTPEEDFLILSQNYEKGWRAQGSLDNTVYERNGLIGVKVNQATTKITLTYRPTSYVFGLWITIFSVILFVLLFFGWSKLGFTRKIDEIFHNL